MYLHFNNIIISYYLISPPYHIYVMLCYVLLFLYQNAIVLLYHYTNIIVLLFHYNGIIMLHNFTTQTQLFNVILS